MQRLKDARSEASVEISLRKSQLQTAFADLEKQHSLKDVAAKSSADVQLVADLEVLRGCFAANRENVLERLLEKVAECVPKPHANASSQH